MNIFLHFSNRTITAIITQNTLTINGTTCILILLVRILGCLHHKCKRIQSTNNCYNNFTMKMLAEHGQIDQ